jgi:hypothetical protein
MERTVFCFQWISEAGGAPQLGVHKDEHLDSNIQTLTTRHLLETFMKAQVHP